LWALQSRRRVENRLQKSDTVETLVRAKNSANLTTVKSIFPTWEDHRNLLVLCLKNFEKFKSVKNL